MLVKIDAGHQMSAETDDVLAVVSARADRDGFADKGV